ncbi:MAG: DnaA/Hda family protein [Mariniblastus sp.]
MCQDVTLSSQDSFENSANADRNFAHEIADLLTDRIGLVRFDLWFSNRDRIARHEDTILFYAENNFALQRIQNTFGQDVREIVNRVCGPQFDVQYKLIDEQTETNPAEPTTSHSISDQANPASAETETGLQTIQFAQPSETQVTKKAEPSTQRRLRTVKSFWFGPNNGLVNAGVDSLFEQPGQFSPFFVYGPTGSGKTHLIESITNDFRRRLKLKRCVYLSAEQFTSQFVGSLRGGTGLPMFRRKYRDLDLLAIDDIQFLAGKRATLGEFQHTIDNLLRNGKQVIVASDRPPVELGHLGNEICARLSQGLTCPIQYPDFDGRMQIVRRMCQERNLELPTNVLRLICDQLAKDVRRLSGAVNRLHAYSVSIAQPITPELAHQVLCDLFSLTGPNCTSMVTIEQAVCELCGVKPAELKSPSRQKRISSARMLAMYLSRQYTGSAFSEIGDYFGGRSHSTAIAAEKKVTKWLANDEGIKLPHAVYPAKEVLRRIESNLRIG